MAKKRIAFDAGHGLYTYGKQDPNGIKEWQYNNKVLKACITHLLETYEDVDIIRLDDPTGKTDVPLKTRTDKANNFKADLLVSIHHNANTGKFGDWGGIETLVMTPLSANPKSHELAKKVHPKLIKAMGLRDRGIKPMNLHMLREASMPAILTEGGFMDSITDIKVMRDDKKLVEQGKAIADGVAEYLKLAKRVAVVVPKEKVGVATMKQDAQSYAEPRFDAEKVRVYSKGDVRNIYDVKDGWYMTFSGDYIPSRSGTNFDYKAVNVIEEVPEKVFHRVVTGSFVEKESAEKRKEELDKLGVESFIIKQKL